MASIVKQLFRKQAASGTTTGGQGGSDASAEPAAAVTPYARSMIAALRTELWPDAAEAPLTLAKIRLAQANMERGMGLMPLISLVCAASYLKWHAIETVAVWYALFMAAWYVRMRVGTWLPHVVANETSVRQAARRYLMYTTLFVGAWASQAVVFWVPGDPVNQLVIVAVLLAGSMSSALTAAWWPAPLVQVTLYIGSAAMMFVAEGSDTALILGVVSLLFARFVIVSAKNLHDAAEKMLSLETEKDVLIAELRASDRAKNEFLANMSHELRTPLNAILGFSELISSEMLGPVGTPKYRDYADDIHISGKHLLSLINDILDHAKIQSGSFVPSDEVVELHAVCDETLRFFLLKAHDGGLKLEADIGSQLSVLADKRGLKQAIANLLSNAIKFTPPGGTVRLGVRRTPFGATLIWVSDTGCGINQDDQKTIFKSFGQGRHDVAIKEKGTGLGLSIVKGIVEAHGGLVSLQSAPACGSTFTITIPASRAAMPLKQVA